MNPYDRSIKNITKFRMQMWRSDVRVSFESKCSDSASYKITDSSTLNTQVIQILESQKGNLNISVHQISPQY